MNVRMLWLVASGTAVACGNEATSTQARPPVVRFCGDEYAIDAFGVRCSDPNVVGASVLAELTSLQTLSLEGTSIRELPRLQHVSQIVTLDLGQTSITDLATMNPSAWTSLRNLRLEGTTLSDLGPIAALPALETLDIRDTQVADLAPALRNPTLQDLAASGTLITALPSLASARALRSLDVSYTLLEDVTTLREAPALETLRVAATLVHDLSPLADAPRLRNVDASSTELARPALDELRRKRPDLMVHDLAWHGTRDELRARIIDARARRRLPPTPADASALDRSP